MREKVKILVVEDNPVVAEDLRETLTRCDYEVVAVADNGKDALDQVKDSNPDLALLDIHLKGDMTGIDVAQLISDQYDFPFIFLSAYSDNATFEEAKITHAYLVKPFNEKDLRLAIELALFNASNRDHDIDYTSKEPARQFLLKQSIFIKEGKHLAKVQLKDVQYLEAFGSYCKLHASDRVFTFSCNLNKVLMKIPEEDFIRIHRSYVVNLQHVTSIDGDFIEITGVKLPIGQTYRKILMERLRLV